MVNDSPEFLELVGDILADERYATALIDGDRPEALDEIIASAPDALIIDLRLGSAELHGWDILQQVRRHHALRTLPVLVCTADRMAVEQLGPELAALPRARVLTKPFEIDELIGAVADLLHPRTAA